MYHRVYYSPLLPNTFPSQRAGWSHLGSHPGGHKGIARDQAASLGALVGPGAPLPPGGRPAEGPGQWIQDQGVSRVWGGPFSSWSRRSGTTTSALRGWRFTYLPCTLSKPLPMEATLNAHFNQTSAGFEG